MRLKLFVSIFLAAIWLGGLYIFHKKANDIIARDITDVDGIVVLTGANFRIKTGINLLSTTNAKRLLISGIDQAVTLKQIKLHYFKNIEHLIYMVDFGYGAFSTVSNALETALWVQKYNFRKIALVTSKLHLPRSLLIFKKILPNTNVLPVAVENNKDIFQVMKEFHKYYATKIIGHFLFDNYQKKSTQHCCTFISYHML